MDRVILPVDVDDRCGRKPRGFTDGEIFAATVIVWASFAVVLGPLGAASGFAVQGWLLTDEWTPPVSMAILVLVYGGIVSGIRTRAAAQVALATAFGVVVVALLSGGQWTGMLGLLPASTAAAAFGWWQVGMRAELRRAQTSSMSIGVDSAASSGSGRA